MKKVQIESTTSRPKVIRQDRYEIHDINCKLHLNDNHNDYTVINYSSFGLAIKGESPFDTKTILLGKLSIENNEICTVKIKPVRQEQFESSYRIAFEVIEGTIPVEKINIYIESIKLANDINASLNHYADLPSEFKKEVYELKNILEHYEHTVTTFESGKKFHTLNDKEEFESTVINAVSPSIHEAIRQTNLKLSPIVEKLDKKNQSLCFDFFRQQLKDLIYQSPFAHRSYSKPLGYAGDFEMMNMIYRNNDAGERLFSRCMERAMQMHSEPQAVRNRSEYLKEKILGCVEANIHNKIKILSVACGPAFEVTKVIKHLSNEELELIEFHLLDQDVLALKNAQHNILSEAKINGKKVNIKLINMPIKQVIIDGMGIDQYDLIYSAGLFDYFTDSVASRAAQVLNAATTSSGKLIIGNFDINTPNKFGMLTLFDWHLILRSKEDLERIFSINNTRLSVEAEENGINLFCVIEKG